MKDVLLKPHANNKFLKFFQKWMNNYILYQNENAQKSVGPP